jgi:hypothetical protein
VGAIVGFGLQSGMKWVIVGTACGTRVAGLLPPGHPGLKFADVS